MEASRVQWGDALAGTARDLLGTAEADDDGAASESRDAAEWLREVLRSGPVPAKEIKRDCDAAGFAWRTVQRAMRRAGVESETRGFGRDRSAIWWLPIRAKESSSAPIVPSNLCGTNGTNHANDTGDVEAFDL